MTILLIIIAALAFLAAWFIFSSIRLRLVFDEPTRLVELSYTFARVSADFQEFKGRLRLFGIKVFEKDLREMLMDDSKKKRPEEKKSPKTGEDFEDMVKDKLKKEPDTEKPEEEKKKKKAPKKKSWRDLDFSMINRKNLRRIKNFIGKINFKDFELRVWGGFSDPYRTGQLTAAYWILKGTLQSFMAHIQYYPDFKIEKFKVVGKGVVSLRIVHILSLVIRLLTSYLINKVKQRFKYQEKGLAYG